MDVQYKPVVSVVKPNDGVYRVRENEVASITCKVDANPEASMVEWKNDGNPFSEGTLSDDNRTLSINTIKREQAGSYVCEATNSRGLGKDSVTVDVLYKPDISLNATYVFKEGDDAAVKCNVDANPAPDKTQWFKGGVPRSPPSQWLNFSSVSRDDDGTYSCVSTNIQNPTGQLTDTSTTTEYTRVKILINNLQYKYEGTELVCYLRYSPPTDPPVFSPDRCPL